MRLARDAASARRRRERCRRADALTWAIPPGQPRMSDSTRPPSPTAGRQRRRLPVRHAGRGVLALRWRLLRAALPVGGQPFADLPDRGAGGGGAHPHERGRLYGAAVFPRLQLLLHAAALHPGDRATPTMCWRSCLFLVVALVCSRLATRLASQVDVAAAGAGAGARRCWTLASSWRPAARSQRPCRSVGVQAMAQALDAHVAMLVRDADEALDDRRRDCRRAAAPARCDLAAADCAEQHAVAGRHGDPHESEAGALGAAAGHEAIAGAASSR